MEHIYTFSMRLVIVLVTIAFLLPVTYMIALSFKTEGIPFFDHGALTVSLVNYRKVLSEAPIFHWMWNSLLVASVQTLMIASPFGIFVLKQFFDGLPKELEEAARMDGAGYFRIWYKIFIPLSRPAFAALGIYSFLAGWNDFLWPLVAVSDRALMTITLGLPNFQSSYMQVYSLPMTANTLAAIPLIVVFIFFQKQIIKGIAFTGGKE